MTQNKTPGSRFNNSNNMKKLLFAFFICLAINGAAQNIYPLARQYEVSSLADNDSIPTRVSKGKDTLYLLNNPMGNMLKQVWVDPKVSKTIPKVVPVIIVVDSFDIIDKKKLALKPSQIKE